MSTVHVIVTEESVRVVAAPSAPVRVAAQPAPVRVIASPAIVYNGGMSPQTLIPTPDPGSAAQTVANCAFVMRACAHEHVQAAAAARWDIQHNMGKKPSFVVLDETGDTVECDVEYVDDRNVSFLFSVPLAGRAYLT